MNLLCRIGIHGWYHFDSNGEKRVCRRCGKLQYVTWVGWDTEGYVTDPGNIIAYYEGEKRRHEEWLLKKEQKAEKTILHAKDYVPKVATSKEEKA